MRNSRILMLVPERDDVIREAETFLVEKEGCELLLVQNGRSAIDAVTEFSPNLVIMDLLLPRVDGIRICKAIKESEHGSGIPIIIMSIIPAEKRSLEAGASVFLLKPISSAALVGAVCGILKGSSAVEVC